MTTNWYTKEYKRLFTGDPWYGDNIIDSLERIPTDHWHRLHGHQTIARIVGHVLAWRAELLRHLRDNTDFNLAYKSPEEWPDVSHMTADELRAQLLENQEGLIKAITDLTADELGQTVPARHKYTREEVINGVLQHDLYHLGQINLLASLLN